MISKVWIKASSLVAPKPSEKKRTAVSGTVQRLVGLSSLLKIKFFPHCFIFLFFIKSANPAKGL
jgi:hypothetical protein